MSTLDSTMQQKLAAPFPASANKFKVQASTKDKKKSLAVFYIDARDVMDRLDATVGAGNWADAYEVVAMGAKDWAVQCSLTICGVTKTDVGEGKAPKDAYSDALKRAAVKFGVARYLYNSPQVWAESEEAYGQTRFTKAGEAAVRRALATYLKTVGVDATEESVGPQDLGESSPSPSEDNPFTDGSTTLGQADTVRRQFHAVGKETYGDQWDKKREGFCKHYGVETSNDLTTEQAQRLIKGMKNAQQQAA